VNELEHQIALITGASRGIGKAIAQRFAAEGAAVVVCASRLGSHGSLEGTLEQTVAEIKAAGGRAAAIACDLTDSEARASLVEQAADCFGPISILVNNAARSTMAVPSEVSTAQRNGMFDLNVNVPVELSQQVLPSMREQGQGWILNISSRTAVQEPPPYPDSKMANFIVGAYGASKAALDRYSEALAHELVEEGIFVNAMAPSNIVMTPGAAYVRDIARRRPDMVEPIEMMAEAALELCSQRHVGRVVFSRDILHAVGRPLRSLDGSRVIGDAFTLADPG
jgi:citronellol/citronellal dehydrogenase